MASLAAASAAPGADGRWRSFSLLFYRAVRDLKPVWMLEDMRTVQASHRRSYSPSEALLYAVVHDHQPYARFLLGRYPDEALQSPGERFCCSPAPAPHLAAAVRYDRHRILGLLLLHGEGGGLRPEDARGLLRLACELRRPEALLTLLGSGARGGTAPLDVALRQLREAGGGPAARCLDALLMFGPEVGGETRAALEAEPGVWRGLLGDGTFCYLARRSPAPLALLAMQAVVRRLSPATFLDSLRELPIPCSLKPPGPRGARSRPR